jgi:hypothetical protein
LGALQLGNFFAKKLTLTTFVVTPAIMFDSANPKAFNQLNNEKSAGSYFGINYTTQPVQI